MQEPCGSTTRFEDYDLSDALYSYNWGIENHDEELYGHESYNGVGLCTTKANNGDEHDSDDDYLPPEHWSERYTN